MTVQYFTFHPHVGKIHHFYHFFFACLIPLIDFKLQHPYIQDFRVFDDLGPFYRMVTQDLPALHVHYANNKTVISDDNIVPLPAYDTFDIKYFNDSRLSKMHPSIRDHVIDYFESTIPQSAKKIEKMWSAIPEPRIVFIQRKSFENGSNFQSSSGTARRYIQNHQKIKSALKLKYRRSFVNLALENMNIYNQFVTFKSANVLIAQHGAALSNMIFMRAIHDVVAPGTRHLDSFAHVIEISPPYSRTAKYFRNMAVHFNVSYSSIPQLENKGDVDLQLLLDHLSCVIGNHSLAQSHGPLSIGVACGDIVGTYAPPDLLPPETERPARRRRRRRSSNSTIIRRRPHNYNETLVKRRKPPNRRAPPPKRVPESK